MDEDLEDPEIQVQQQFPIKLRFLEAFGMEGAKSNEASVTLPVLNCYTPGLRLRLSRTMYTCLGRSPYGIGHGIMVIWDWNCGASL